MEAESILGYLVKYGPQTTFRLSSVLKIDRERVINILNKLAEEGVVEVRTGVARALKETLPKPEAKLKPAKPVFKPKKFRRKPRLKVKKKVKKEVIKEIPRIIRKKVVKEVIPEEKLEELETKIEAKLGGRVGGVKEALTSKIKELADAELNLVAKLKELEKKISEIEARPAVKPKILKQFKVPRELKEKIEELSKKLLEFRKPAVPKPEPKKTEVEEAKPKKAEKKKPWFKPKPFPSPPKPEVEKKRKVRIKLKFPKLKVPQIKIPRLFKLPKPKTKPARREIKRKIKAKRKGRLFSKISSIGETKLFSRKI